METSAVTSATTPMVGAAADDPNTMSSVDFMHLLVTELQNQDPLEPMSTTEMSSQLSQMTMNEQLTEMAATMEENLAMSQSINNTGMLALVGREVTVAGDEVHVSDGQATGSMIHVAGGGTAAVEVRDAGGSVVASYHVDVDAGLNHIDWDGLDLDGDPAADGEYTVAVTVTDADGEEMAADVLMTGAVGGLRYEQGIAVVDVFGHEFYVSEIYQVS
jgi:flagellar basal-body rod modification protein FlgD